MSLPRSSDTVGSTSIKRAVANQLGMQWCRAAALLLGAALASRLLPAQSSDTLGTKLTLSGQTLNFRWDPKHPWSGQMSSSGVQLFAEYVTERQGRVVQKLDAGRPAMATDPSVTLHLPDVLEAVPTGNVCLYLQVTNGRRIPVRKSRSGDADTEHFAVPDWGATVSANSINKIQRGRKATLEAAVKSGETAVQAQTEAIKKKGWTDSASCEAVKAPSFAPSERPADAFPAEEHDALARQVCIRRVVEKRLPLALGLPNIKVLYRPRLAALSLPDPLIGSALLQYLRMQKHVDREDLNLREAEFAVYKADWARWRTSTEADIRQQVPPAFGSLGEELVIQDVTAAVGLEILDFTNLASPVLRTSPQPQTKDVLGYLGGAMETYTRCVHDGQDELAAKLRAWTEQVQRAPMLETIARNQLRTQCLEAFSDLDKQRQQLALVQQQLDTERQQQAKEPSSAPTANTQTAVLNGAACTVK